MDYIIRKANTEDGYGKEYVHFKAWHETYVDMIHKEYLDTITLEKCLKNNKNFTDNVLVAVVENKIVGFCSYLINSRDFVSIHPSSEIVALYVLKEYQGYGIGRALLSSTINLLKEKSIILYVLDKNEKAINFYKKNNFIFTESKVTEEVINGRLIELEMILKK